MQETQEIRVQSLGQEVPLAEELATYSSIIACGQRNMVGYSPWGRQESDVIEQRT